jgi:hypothetical protein
VPAGAATCDLCGATVGSPSEAAADDAADASPDEPGSGAPSAEPEQDAPDAPDAVYCNACGWENPTGANYCSQCGSELQDLGEPSAPSGARPVTADLPSGSDPEEAAPAEAGAADEEAEMGQRILLVVGVAVALVLGLFAATQWSQQYEWGEASEESAQATGPATAGGSGTETGAAGPQSAGGAPSSGAAAAPAPTDLSTLVDRLSGPVDGPTADEIDSLRAAVEAADGDQRRQLRAQLVNLYVGAGAPGRAALLQSTLAEQTGRAEDRRRAADLLYKWMRQVEQQEGRAKVADVARHVAEGYAAVVEQRPEDLDARTRMGEAYLLTNNPMKGIRAINQVLEDDSTFVPARFQKGLALLQINRLNQAIAEFEKVMTYASQDDPFYRQAERAIRVIREQAGSSGQNRSSGS